MIRDFFGETPELGVAMGLLFERIYKKLSCDKFMEKLKNYVLNNFKHAEDIGCVSTDLTDKTTNFESNFITSGITEEE